MLTRSHPDLSIPASNIIVGGDSAGGGLSMALMLYLRDSKKLPQIGGGILLSPWVDSTSSLKSWESNAVRVQIFVCGCWLTWHSTWTT